MDNLSLDIQEAFDVISLILVFVTILFDLRYPRIQSDLRKEIPDGEKARQQLRRELRQNLLTNCVPLLMINGIASYLFLPLLVRILSESHLDLWGFDFARTAFVLVAVLVTIFFLWSVYLAYRVVRRMVKSR